MDTPRPGKMGTLTFDLAIDVGPGSLRYPDVIVDALGNNAALTATAPALIAEVLSPSSIRIDLRDKAAEYLQLPSLMAYLVLSQDDPLISAWVRTAIGFPANAIEVKGMGQIIAVTELGIDLTLAEIYTGT